MRAVEFERDAASVTISTLLSTNGNPYRRCTFAETSKASSGGPKNCPEGKTDSSYFSLL
jgi:hypothetical protein